MNLRLLKRALVPEFPFVRWSILVPLLVFWTLSTALLTVWVRTPDHDSIMYGLPLAWPGGLFPLKVPLLGDFPVYSTVWGHQWPGAMWLRGALFQVIPYERWMDIFLLMAAQLVAALMVGRIVWQITHGAILAVASTVLVLSDRFILLGVANSRWESLIVLAVVGLFYALASTAGKKPPGKPRTWKWQLAAAFLAAFVAASSHPFGMVLTAGLLGLAGFDWLILRRRRAITVLVPVAGFAVGLAAMAAYFLAVPEAFGQLQRNLALQASFRPPHSLDVIAHLREYRLPGFLLWSAVLLAAPVVFLVLRKHAEAGPRFCAWALPLMALALPVLYLLARPSNPNYLSLGLPFATALAASAIGLVFAGRPRFVSITASLAFALLALGFFAIYPYRWLVFFKAGRPNFSAELESFVKRLPEGRTAFVPVSLWDAARKDPRRDYRLYSLCIAAPWETRLAYERQAYAKAKAGDILVVDSIYGSTGDRWGYLPTFEARPPDAKYWKPLFDQVHRVRGSGHDFGYDLTVYEFVGEPWDPTLTPRKSISGR